MKKKIAIITSSEITITSFLIGYINALSELYSITLILNIKDSKKFKELFQDKNIKLINLKILRGIDLFQDIKSLLSLIKIFIKSDYDGVFSITPKAGFLSMLAGFICRVKFRLHYFTGQVWVTRKGFQRTFLRNIDRLMGFLATHVLTDSNSQKQFLEEEKIIKKGRLKVLANGSICGVDTNQFKPNLNLKKEIRKNLGIPDESILLLFLGRLNRDKGVLDLADVLNNLNNKSDYENKIHLLIIGPDEENIKQQVEIICSNYIRNIHFMDFTDEPEKFMAAADIFCLPSYREGFGMAALEAGACALPTVTSRIYGLTDAVGSDTGLFHAPGDIKGIETAIVKLVNDKNLRLEMGSKGRERTKNLFEKSYVVSEFMNYLNGSIELYFRKKIVIISSTEISIKAFLQEQIKMLSKHYDLTLITNVHDKDALRKILPKINIVNMNIRREISYLNDIICLIKLFIIFLKGKYKIVFSITPKGGFLSITSSYLAGVKNRVHWYGGQVWVTRKGFQRTFLRNIDRLMGFLATHVLTDSNSQKQFLEEEKIIKKGRLKVLANGSICGVDTNQFKPNLNLKKEIRKNLGIPDESILLLFLGRLNRDKGVLDLADVLNNLNNKSDYENKIHLLIIGPDEENIKQQVEIICSNYIRNIHFMDFTDEPEKFMAAADIFCLPSYREGFGMAALEAGACALPTVTSRIYGLTDAVGSDTGLFHAPGDIKGIETAIVKLVNDKNLRLEMGSKGRERTKNLFEKNYVTSEFVEYMKTLN